MAEQRLIDANAFREDWLKSGENEYVYDTNSFLSSIDDAPTIDPESLPVVRQLREELARVTEERDALLPRKGHLSAEMGDGCVIIYRHNRESLEESQNVVMVKYTPQYVEVGYSETGKEGPYTMAINADEYGAITMAQEVAEAIFGFIRDKEAHP